MSDAYAAAGVDTGRAEAGVAALVSVLAEIDPGRPSRSVLGSGHYASVLSVGPNLGVALTTDGVGSKLVLAAQLGRLDTVGIDCVAMNANDLVCVGAEPLAMLDYLAVERVQTPELQQIATGLLRGAELAGIEIPGGELAVLPELIRGHPPSHGFDLCGTCMGTVPLDRLVVGTDCRPGDALIGLPASGLHSNGYTLARRAVAEAGLALDACPAELGGATLGEALLEPTVLYVRAVLGLLASGLDVRGLAHITGDGLLNLLRLGPAPIGFRIDAPLPVPPVCELVCGLAAVPAQDAYRIFNMGCGFVAAVAAADADAALGLLRNHHPGAALIGEVTGEVGTLELPGLGLAGDRTGLRVSD